MSRLDDDPDEMARLQLSNGEIEDLLAGRGDGRELALEAFVEELRARFRQSDEVRVGAALAEFIGVASDEGAPSSDQEEASAPSRRVSVPTRIGVLTATLTGKVVIGTTVATAMALGGAQASGLVELPSLPDIVAQIRRHPAEPAPDRGGPVVGAVDVEGIGVPANGRVTPPGSGTSAAPSTVDQPGGGVGVGSDIGGPLPRLAPDDAGVGGVGAPAPGTSGPSAPADAGVESDRAPSAPGGAEGEPGTPAPEAGADPGAGPVDGTPAETGAGSGPPPGTSTSGPGPGAGSDSPVTGDPTPGSGAGSGSPVTGGPTPNPGAGSGPPATGVATPGSGAAGGAPAGSAGGPGVGVGPTADHTSAPEVAAGKGTQASAGAGSATPPTPTTAMQASPVTTPSTDSPEPRREPSEMRAASSDVTADSGGPAGASPSEVHQPRADRSSGAGSPAPTTAVGIGPSGEPTTHPTQGSPAP